MVGFSFRALMVFLILCPLLIAHIAIKIPKGVLRVGAGLLIMVGLVYNQDYSSEKHDPPYKIYRNVADKITKIKDVDFELIIGHKALAEYVTFKTAIDVLPWEPEYKVDEDKLWRICTGINKKSIRYFGKKIYSPELIYYLSPNYLLVREDLWDCVINNLEKDDPDFLEELLSWKNPHLKRPSYMMKYKNQ